MILVNGDSFTFGDGLTKNESPWPNLLFNESFKNIAQSGSSNQSIYRRSLEELYTNKYETLILNWSFLFRIELSDNYNKAKTVLLNSSESDSATKKLKKELISNWHNELWYFKLFLINLQSLKLHCDHLKVKFYCFNIPSELPNLYSDSFWKYSNFHKLFELSLFNDNEIEFEYNFLTTLKEKTKSCWLIPPYKSIYEFYSTNIISQEDLHPNQLGHNKIAEGLRHALNRIE